MTSYTAFNRNNYKLQLTENCKTEADVDGCSAVSTHIIFTMGA